MRFARFTFGAALVYLFGDILDRWIQTNPKGFALGMLAIMILGFLAVPLFV